MATARKFMKKCTRAGISKKECKAIAKRKTTVKARRIKVCKMSDPAVKNILSWVRTLRAAARRGDGSGAEDRFIYDVDDLVRTVKGKCGLKFAKKLSKNARKLK